MHEPPMLSLTSRPMRVLENLAESGSDRRQTIELRDVQRVHRRNTAASAFARGDQLGQTKADGWKGEIHVALLYDRVEKPTRWSLYETEPAALPNVISSPSATAPLELPSVKSPLVVHAW
jgi:hypothetical protein